MPNKTDKNVLKQHFRSGSRPTQEQFHELIDSCYNNDVYTSFVPGYQLLVNREQNRTYSSIKREAGRTVLVPFFDRINITQYRVFHFGIPVSNLGKGYIMDKLLVEIGLPESTDYTVQDKREKVQITQKITVKAITIYNGSEEIFTTSPKNQNGNPMYEIKVGKAAGQWKGVGIDITVEYDIQSDLAVSDQLDITAKNAEKLEHAFGSAGCVFIQND